MGYWIIKAISFVLLKTFFGFKVEGKENIPQKTNFIIVANHSSFLDPIIVQSVCPRKIHCLVWDKLYRNLFMRFFLWLEECISIGGVASLKAMRFLKQNRVIGIFPEGGRSFDGKLKEFKRGAALLALKTGRPIVPCAIVGAHQAYPRGALFPRMHPIKIKIGKPVYLLKEFEDVIEDIYLQDGIFRIRRSIEEMLNAG